jgi:acetylcholinesterase
MDGPPSIYNTDAREFKITDATSEDCLTVSIWVPKLAVNGSTPVALPVIVWIFGGAYVIGGSTVPYQNPSHWVENSQRHIIICIK